MEYDIRKELGEELWSWYAENPKGLADISSILSSYVKIYEETKEKLHHHLCSIDPHNYEARIVPLILSSRSDGSNRLLELFERANICLVRDLWRFSELRLEQKDCLELTSFVEWLKDDKQATLKAEFHSLFKKSRDKEIISKRARGAKLEETSAHYGLTHEGIRLVEKKFQSRFDCFLLNAKPYYLLYAFSQNIGYVTFAEINEQLGDLADVFTYYLKLSNCPTTHWSDELDGFVIGHEKWYDQLKEYKKSLPEILDCEAVDEFVAKVSNELAVPLTFTDTKQLLLADYNLSGKVYLKKRISLTSMYYAVLERYYPDGIKLYDDFEAARFRNYVRELFGDVPLPENNRAIDVRLTELTILCDKGKRILPSGIKIPAGLLKKIHDAIIEFDRNEIMFRALFEKFKSELLENSNITNKYFLQGVLKQHYAKEFNFTRYALKK